MNYQELYSQAVGKRKTLLTQSTEYKNLLELYSRKQLAIEQVQALIQTVAKETQEQIKVHIEDVVNAAIDTCFPDEYQFSMEFEIKRGKTEASMKFIKNGFEVNPMDSTGGGLVDIASFALRVAAWSLGTTANVLILDEPMKFLSRDLQNRAGEILQEISRELKIQIIMVSHIPDIIGQADHVIMVKKVKNVTCLV